MNALLLKPAESKLLPYVTKRLSVVIACEDWLAVQSAAQIRSQVIEQLGEDRDFETQAWRFSELENPAVALESATAAAEADFVVVASRSLAPLPMTVKAWLERWL